MAHIKSRKHAPKHLNHCMTAALAAAMASAYPAIAAAQTSDQTLPTVTVTSQKEGSIKADTASSPKYTQPLLDTPQTITVIKKELIDQQHATTLTEALRNTPGVGAFSLGENGSTSTGDAVYMRGFDASANIYVDNVRDLGAISRDMFNIESVEVLKGPSGTDNGRGAPNGSINLVTAQPRLDDSFNASVTGGSASNKRGTIDWNKVLDVDKGMAFRLNLMDQDSGVAGRNEVKNKRWGVAPSFAWGLESRTRVFMDYLHLDQDNVPENGVPTVGLPGYSFPAAAGSTPAVVRNSAAISAAPGVNPNNYYGSKNDFDKATSDMFTVRVEHDFSPMLKLQNTTRYAKTSQNYQITGFMGAFNTAAIGAVPALTPGNLSTYALTRSRQMKDQTNEILTNQTNLTGEFLTGDIKHTMVGGIEFTREKQNAIGYTTASLGTMPAANLYNPNTSDPVTGYNPTRSGADSSGTMDTVSTYVFDTLKLNDRWQLSGGVRYDHYKTSYDSATLSTAAANPTLPVGTLLPQPSLGLSGGLFNWKVGALYKPTENSSIYASYSTSKQPPGGSNFALSTAANSAANIGYDPQETKSAEIGAKWDILDKTLGLTAAVYRTKVSNEVSQDPVSLAYFQTGQKQVQGIELGVIGNITTLWSVSAGYSRMNTDVTGSSVSSDGSSNLAYTPKQAFTSWTSYKLPYGFSIGGGARFVDALIRASDGAVGTPRYTDSYWVYDGMVGYTVSKNMDLQLNLYNLTNKTYVSAINKSGYRYQPGVERSFTLTANLRF